MTLQSPEQWKTGLHWQNYKPQNTRDTIKTTAGESDLWAMANISSPKFIAA